MRIILGATIGLLVLVAAGLAVFAYTEHREVAYLTLRADHLESRINELEARHSTVDNPSASSGEADANASAAMPSLSLEEIAKLEETNRIRKDRYGLGPMSERDYRALHPSTSTITPTSETPTLEEINRWRRSMELPPLEQVTTPEPQRSSWYQSFVTPAPTPEPVAYTDQQLYETRDQGPNRPGCAGLRPRMNQLPNWMQTDFLDAFGCATVADRLDQLERQQRDIEAEQSRERMEQPYEYHSEKRYPGD